MYWEGSQLWRPEQRPYALHRNGYAGMARYGAFLWSGDVYSTWETLQTHVPVAVNTGLSGIPYWGTDIGGFVPAAELHNTQVETICKKYLELRYRLMPYIYSAVRETALTGMPIVRALWLHHSD